MLPDVIYARKLLRLFNPGQKYIRSIGRPISAKSSQKQFRYIAEPAHEVINITCIWRFVFFERH